MNFVIRDGKPEDRNFVLATFLNGLYHGDSWFSMIDKRVFMDNYKPVAMALIQRHQVKVACLPDDEDTILGYSILSHDYQTIHWVYVKSSKMKDGATWRRKGIAKALLPENPTTVSHLTYLGKTLMIKFPNAKFNPFTI